MRVIAEDNIIIPIIQWCWWYLKYWRLKSWHCSLTWNFVLQDVWELQIAITAIWIQKASLHIKSYSQFLHLDKKKHCADESCIREDESYQKKSNSKIFSLGWMPHWKAEPQTFLKVWFQVLFISKIFSQGWSLFISNRI